MTTGSEAAQRAKPTDNPVERLAAMLAQDLAATDRFIHDYMASEVALIPQIATHLVDSGGKRIRPLITLGGARLFGYSGDAHERLAAAVEFIHTATLLHDDVVDESAMRRGRAAAHKVWGNKPTILVGDFLFSRAFQLMVSTGHPPVLDMLANASAIISEGEVLQLRATRNLAATEDDYLAVITAKTAALFSAAAESGAVLAGGTAAHCAALREYGRDLGIAFQLIDDALDYSGRQAVMGKRVGDDFRESKMTLPVIFALRTAGEDERRFWKKTIEVGLQDEGDLTRAIEILERNGALAETVERAKSYAAAARAALAPAPDGAIKTALADIADFVVERAY